MVSASILAASLSVFALIPSAMAYWQPPMDFKFQIVLQSEVNTANAVPVSRIISRNDRRKMRRAISSIPLPSGANSGVGVFDIDLFDNNAETISSLHGSQKRVICYFSAGTYEPYRDDSGSFSSSDMGETLPEWPVEKWLDLSSPNVRDLMLKRLDLAKAKGCDAVDPDNMDGYTTSNGLGLTEEGTVEFIQFLSEAAHARGLSYGLKNAIELIDKVTDHVEFAVNEECAKFGECNHYDSFLAAGKPVLHIEYPDGAPDMSKSQIDSVCSSVFPGSPGVKRGFNTVLKTYDLNGWAAYCDGTVVQA